MNQKVFGIYIGAHVILSHYLVMVSQSASSIQPMDKPCNLLEAACTFPSMYKSAYELIIPFFCVYKLS